MNTVMRLGPQPGEVIDRAAELTFTWNGRAFSAGFDLKESAAKGALKSAAGPLAAQLAAEQGKVQYLKVNEDLRRLGVKLSRL